VSRVEIVAGGQPPAAELAALVVALEPAPGGSEVAGTVVAAWTRAALTEATTATTVCTPSDLERPGR